MLQQNRKKLFTIKAKIFNYQFAEMKKKKQDEEFMDALSQLGNALNKIEEMYGDVD